VNFVIAAKGAKFTIEWYLDQRGISQAYVFFNKSSTSQQDKVLALFFLMAEHGKIYNMTKFRHEGDAIYAFKIDQDRYFSFFCKDKKIIITNAYTKKSPKMPSKEKEKALLARKNYIERCQKGTYYEEEN